MEHRPEVTSDSHISDTDNFPLSRSQNDNSWFKNNSSLFQKPLDNADDSDDTGSQIANKIQPAPPKKIIDFPKLPLRDLQEQHDTSRGYLNQTAKNRSLRLFDCTNSPFVMRTTRNKTQLETFGDRQQNFLDRKTAKGKEVVH